MITNFKIFEELKYKVEYGDYVVMTCDPQYEKRYKEFFENNIGRVTWVGWPGAWFSVEYENAPRKIQDYLNNKGEFHTDHILYHSKNREDCEAFLAAKKYNL